jgi:HAD superfamily hydrolase (TIGR01459 family)
MPSSAPPQREIRILTGLEAFLAPYDGLILDLWGVVHDGRHPYPGVTDTLARIKASGRKVVMLSNAPRRSSAVIDGMTEIGIDRDLYDDVLSSGELAWRALAQRTSPWAAALGRRCLHVGPARDDGLLDGLGLTTVDRPEEGAFILNTGPWEDGETVADYEPLLSEAAECSMPMVCANPDIEVIRAGNRIICAGALASRYEELGGAVHQFGKPYGETYRACLDLMGIDEPDRLLAIGDSLSTDIRGAAGMGIDSVLVTSGIHGAELGLAYGETPTRERLEEACAAAGVFPCAAIAAFVW